MKFTLKDLEKLKDSKISYLDAAYYGTVESVGEMNAKAAIKYCLFDDATALQGTNPIANKWNYISTKQSGRIKAKQMQYLDLYQILAKYSMAMFGISGRDIKFSSEDLLKLRKNPKESYKYTNEEWVELAALSNMENINTAYLTMSICKEMRLAIVNELIKERYEESLKDELDSFNGMLTNEKISVQTKWTFKEQYKNIDLEYMNMKQDAKDYVKFATPE